MHSLFFLAALFASPFFSCRDFLRFTYFFFALACVVPRSSLRMWCSLRSRFFSRGLIAAPSGLPSFGHSPR